VAAVRELREETGLEARGLTLLFVELEPKRCRRPGGDWHRWEVFEAKVTGELRQNLDETKQVMWCDAGTFAWLAQRTREYRAGQMSEEEWELFPGLEPVWYDFFHYLGEV
jgi:ADP-ribose pyrophosphatase YjhB (NUDIX family)